ncbi:phosphatase PAP2 family protein [Abyssalbus ytuae]|uniref:Phosphatase PAP2 family protein n=1 Tax=Abyssalbus ytuae TaxID=2926907 RepID=A0A9E7D2X1_9FLAO|nr:phosphatase PAP2 family protein [Abyssalbus ytuae]UOB18623.1 phosphatase PAP2 family protein [Abyssalbus ytuae]
MRELLYTSIFLIASVVLAQENNFLPDRSDKNVWEDFTYDMGNVFQGVGYTYTRPLHWKKNDFLKLGGVVAGTLTIYAFDDNIQRELRSHESEVPDVLLDYGWYAGSPQNNYGFTGAVYLTGLFSRNEKLRRTGVLLISSATATGLIQQLTKSAVGRARPGTGFGKNHFRPFGGSAAYRSFPSGHGVLTFTNAHVIAKQFRNPWVKAGIYTIGIIPGISRIYADAHWASDVFLSWAMSYFVVEAIDIYLDSKYNEKYNDTKRNKTSLSLTFNGNAVGARFLF